MTEQKIARITEPYDENTIGKIWYIIFILTLFNWIISPTHYTSEIIAYLIEEFECPIID